MQEVKGYACDFCKDAKKVKRVYATPGSCKRHEQKCFRNPASKACATCGLWDEREFGAGSHEEPDATATRRVCRDEHDCIATDACNGSVWPPTPQRECEHWVPNAELRGGPAASSPERPA